MSNIKDRKIYNFLNKGVYNKILIISENKVLLDQVQKN